MRYRKLGRTGIECRRSGLAPRRSATAHPQVPGRPYATSAVLHGPRPGRPCQAIAACPVLPPLLGRRRPQRSQGFRG